MAATTRTITDKIYELDGTPLVGGMLTIERLTWPAIDTDGTVADTVVSGTTDEAGAVSLDVVVPPTGAARYRMTRPSGAGRQSHIYYFTLGAGSAITVREILAASATTDDADTIQDLIAGYLLAANNLSDVEDAATARTNLGLGSAAVAASGDFDAAGSAATVQSALSSHVGDTNNPHGVSAAQAGAEPALGNPGSDGYVLASTAAGVRSWVAQSGGGASDVGDLATASGSAGEMVRVAAGGGLEYRSAAQVLADLGAAPTASPTFSGNVTAASIVGSVIKPSSDSTTALVLANAAGASVLIVDTTNKYVNLAGANAVVQLGGARFIHTYASPTGSGAVPEGKNTFVGVEAGNLSLGSTATQTYHGSSNSAVGYRALYAATTGYYNMAFGTSALRFLTSGYANVAIGTNAIFTLTTGYYNIGVGDSALFFLAGDSNSNVAVGRQAGQSHASGNLTTANGCIYIGTLAKAAADSVTNEIVIGNAATGAGSNTVTLGNTSITTTKLRGIVDFTGTFGDSAKNPTTDAPADWIEVKLNGTTYYLPAYAAS